LDSELSGTSTLHVPLSLTVAIATAANNPAATTIAPTNIRRVNG
jgi:hypothetical protein